MVKKKKSKKKIEELAFSRQTARGELERETEPSKETPKESPVEETEPE